MAKGIEVHPKNETSIKACIMVFSLGSIAFVLMFVASELVSVSQMSVLFQTNSIWVPILGIFILKDALNFVQTVSIILSFFGVILIVDPSILSLDNKGSLSDIAEDNTKYTQSTMYFGAGLGLITGFCVGLKRVLTIKWKDAIDSTQNLFYNSLGAAFGTAMVNVQMGSNNVMGSADIPILIIFTLDGLIYHLMLVPCLRLEPNGTISSIIGNLAIFWGFLMDILQLDKSFNMWNAVGGILVFLTTILVSTQKSGPIKDSKLTNKLMA